jgi:D-alanine-D-alanine ligase-like ATP-grasp enzyme
VTGDEVVTLPRRDDRISRALGRVELVRALGPVPALRHRMLASRWFDAHPSFANDVYAAIWREAAQAVDAKIRDRGRGFLEISNDGRSTWVWRQFVALDDVVTVRRSLDKEIVHRLLDAEGLAVPPHVAFSASELGPARRFLSSAPGPCVVKPASGTGGGSGISADVRAGRDLVLAAAAAGRYGDRLLIERQLRGDMYRLLFLEGVLVDAVRRRSPRIVGDGDSTVRELIAAENRRRLAARGRDGLALLRVDLSCLRRLRDAGWTLRSVPPAGEPVTLKTASSENRVEDNETVNDQLGERLVSEAARAARASGLHLVGVDIVTPDPAQGLGEGGGAIVEVNCTPGLHYHYLVRDQARATRVAVPLLRHLLSTGAAPSESGTRR